MVVLSSTMILHILRKTWQFCGYMVNFFPPVKNFVMTVIITVILHVSVLKFYGYMCAPPGISGMVYTFFNMGNPICVTTWNLAHAIQNHFMKMWSGIVIGSVLSSFIKCI